MLGEWKPTFIHSDVSKKLVCEIIREAGLAIESTTSMCRSPVPLFPRAI